MSAIREAWVGVHRRRDLRPIHEWAKDNTDLKAPLTITGPFNVSTSRHFIGPLDALQDDRVRQVNILKPVRGGGTLIADIWIPWTRVNDPGPTMMVLQTDPIADDHYQKVLLPTLESVPEIKRLLDGLEKSKKTIRKIEFSDGNHLHINGPSVGNLQTNAFRFVIEDECYLYPERMLDAEARVGDFARQKTSKILRVSQGGPKENIPLDECAWRRAYERASIYEWEVQCPHCSKFHEAVFSGSRDDGTFWGIVWNRYQLPNGDWDISRCAETVRFECQHCGKPSMDTARTKAEWNRTGKYELTTPETQDAKSFHWEAIIADGWAELAALWLDACNAERRGDLGPKLQFYKKRRAIHKDEQSLLKGGLNLKRTVYEIGPEADPNEAARFLTIDRQEEDMFWWTVRAWLKDGRSRRLAFGKAYGFAALEESRQKWKVEAWRTLIDSAYVPKGDFGVYAACVKYGWIAVRGDDAWQFTHTGKNRKPTHKSYSPATRGDPGAGTSGQGRRTCALILFSKGQMNEVVQRLIDHGQWEEPQGADDPEMEKEYNLQMSSRIKKSEFNVKTGATKVFWYEGKNDHARDLANMQALGAILLDLLPDPCAERLTKTEAATVSQS